MERDGYRGSDRGETRRDDVVGTIEGGSVGGDHDRFTKRSLRDLEQSSKHVEHGYVGSVKASTSYRISFGPHDLAGVSTPHCDPLVIVVDMADYEVERVLVDSGSSVNILFLSAFNQMGLKHSMLKPHKTPLQGFGGAIVEPIGAVTLQTRLSREKRTRVESIQYVIVDAPFAYNAILGRPALNQFEAAISTFCLKLKFPTRTGVGEVLGDQRQVRSCYLTSLKSKEKTEKEILSYKGKENISERSEATKRGRTEANSQWVEPQFTKEMGKLSFAEMLAKKQAEIDGPQPLPQQETPRCEEPVAETSSAQPPLLEPTHPMVDCDTEMPEMGPLEFEAFQQSIADVFEPPHPQPQAQPSILLNEPPGVGVSLVRGLCLDRDMAVLNALPTVKLNENFCNSISMAAQYQKAMFDKSIVIERQARYFEKQARAFSNQFNELQERFTNLQLEHQAQSHKMTELEGDYRTRIQHFEAVQKQTEDGIQARLIKARQQGIIDYQNSEEYKQMLARHKKESIKNYKCSSSGQNWVETRGIEYFILGYTRCQSQFDHSGFLPLDMSRDFLVMRNPAPGEYQVQSVAGQGSEDEDDEDEEETQAPGN